MASKTVGGDDPSRGHGMIHAYPLEGCVVQEASQLPP